MRFRRTYPQNGEVRTRTFFAWWPVSVGWPQEETRWLERVTVVEVYESNMYDSGWAIKRFANG